MSIIKLIKTTVFLLKYKTQDVVYQKKIKKKYLSFLGYYKIQKMRIQKE